MRETLATLLSTKMLLHNTVDFNLQAPANALLFVSVLALSQLAYHNSQQPRFLQQ
ncbi:MAG: hypothetical protein KKE30_19315 [Gammaproteobacteria bacterium]|nr:hypothetical protein [Gammaproteobacteria bacterium]MBU1554921.1 hypothetical protein [Gammaproteobacteria bacterium]MBU2069078.1 hypothetical protein [Gammaproteobacteria bacterium]MBU2182667.1 hypothetical protein [Gammaproteobacteria bacterium]MBU2206594.1 hypothetical protein [Gammaproteobacteria bacterium]